MNLSHLIAVATLTASAGLVQTQSQPMAVPPTTLRVTANQPAQVQAFCLDENLDVPNNQHRLTPRSSHVRVTRRTSDSPVYTYTTFDDAGIEIVGDGDFGLIFSAPNADPNVSYEIVIDKFAYFADGQFSMPNFDTAFNDAVEDLAAMWKEAEAAAPTIYLPALLREAQQLAIWQAQAMGDLKLVDEIFIHRVLPAVRETQREFVSQLSLMGLSPEGVAEVLVLLNSGERLAASQISQIRSDGIQVVVPDEGLESIAFRLAMAAGRGGGPSGPRGPAGPGGGGPGGFGGGAALNGGTSQVQPFDTDRAVRAYFAAYAADDDEEEFRNRIGLTR